MDPVAVNGRPVGDGNECYVIAATGSGHNGSLEQAKQLIDGAVYGGANAIMFQAYGGDLYHDESPAVRRMVDEGRIDDRPGAFAEYMQSRVMDPSWHPELSRYASENGIDYIPSVFGDADLQLLAEYHRQGQILLAAIGIESMDHQDPIFVAKVASVARDLDIPVVMSTGVREGNSMERAAVTVDQVGAEMVLLHSVAGSPSVPHEQGLGEIRAMQQRLGVPVGFSDHTIGYVDPDTGEPVDSPSMAQAAVYENAHAIKAQIRLPDQADKAPGGPHRAVTPDGLRDMVTAIREAEAYPARAARRASDNIRIYQGRSDEPRPSERHLRDLQRTVIPTTDIAEGDELSWDNVTTGRGGVGMPARDFGQGAYASEDLQAGRAVRAEQLRPFRPETGNPTTLQRTPRRAPGAIPRNNTRPKR
ncbi:MAG: N-acetylneuraminate synthase family protein [Mycobacteriales bacterium]